jgi:hypothetical protein
MPRSSLRAGLLAAGVVVGFSLPRPAHGQVATVSFASVEEVLTDFRYLGTMVGQSAEASAFAAEVRLRTGFFAGVDTNRPFGVYFDVPAAPGDWPPPVFFVPVKNEADFARMLRKLDWTVGEPARLRGPLPDPSAFRTAGQKDHLVVASLRPDRLPADHLKALFRKAEKGISAEAPFPLRPMVDGWVADGANSPSRSPN